MQDIDQTYLKYQISITPRPYILKENSPIKFYWDLYVIILALLSVFYLPIIFAFDYSYEDTKKFDKLTLIIDFFFLIDIIMIFRTTYVNDKTGDEIWGPKMIAINYIKSPNLYLDILSTIPFEFATFV